MPNPRRASRTSGPPSAATCAKPSSSAARRPPRRSTISAIGTDGTTATSSGTRPGIYLARTAARCPARPKFACFAFTEFPNLVFSTSSPTKFTIMINTRNGPRDSDEVRIDAAKQLLSIKLVKDAGGASKGLQAQRVRPAASAASNSAPGNDQVP